MSDLGHNGGPEIDDRAGNWIAVSRDLIEHHIVGAGRRVEPADKNAPLCFNRMEAWLDLLCLANYVARTVDLRGASIILEPGQTLAGRAFLSKRWNWTEKTVRGFLERLERELMISFACQDLKEQNLSTGSGSNREALGQKTGHIKGHLPNIVTICNWSKFQGAPGVQGPPQGPPEGHPRATQGPHYNKGTRKQEKEEKVKGIGAVSLDAQPESLSALAAPAAPDRSPDGIDPFEAFEAWNALALRIGLQQARSLTPQRRKSLVARIREHGGMAAWARALAMVERSAFLRGQNDRGWRADLDFVLQTRSFAKLIDGGYGNGAHAPASHAPPPKNRVLDLIGKIARGEAPPDAFGRPARDDSPPNDLKTITTEWSETR